MSVLVRCERVSEIVAAVNELNADMYLLILLRVLMLQPVFQRHQALAAELESVKRKRAGESMCERSVTHFQIDTLSHTLSSITTHSTHMCVRSISNSSYALVDLSPSTAAHASGEQGEGGFGA